jgi:hypothetical protein
VIATDGFASMGSCLARPPLVGKYGPDEVPHRLRPLRPESEEILVLSEEKPAEFRRMREERLVVQLRGLILSTREHIDPSPPQSVGDCQGNMHIHVNCQRHGQLPAPDRGRRVSRRSRDSG